MRYDVVVVGGRCAGSPLAMLLARAGLRVLLVDRAEFPSDIVNGHLVKPAGAARLEGWGLLGEVLATGAPPVTRRRLVIGDSVKEQPPPGDAPPPVAPRRIVLDQVLLEAARRAGADVRTRTPLRHLLVDGGRVTGVRLGDAAGWERDVLARIVVGADGRGSLVARQAGAAVRRHDGTTSICYWAYWHGIAPDRAVMALAEGLAAGLVPTNDGLAVVWVQAPLAAAPEFRSDPAGRYLRAVHGVSVIADVLGGASARREGRVLGMVSLPNYVRQAHGPGWALLGDAGHHKDPLAARGIADAFRDAELLAVAMERGLGGADGELAAELARYERERDEANAGVFEANLVLSRLDRPLAELPSLLGRVTDAEALADTTWPPRHRGGMTPVSPLGR